MSLAHFQERSREIEAQRITFNQQIQFANERISEAAVALNQAERDYAGQPEKIVPYRESVRRLKQERADIRMPSRGDALPEIEKWLARHPKATPADPISADIRKGETALRAHNRHKVTTDGILKKISGIEDAPLPADTIRDQAKAEIRSWAKAPAILNGKLLPPKSLVQVGANAVALPDALGVIAWAFPELLIAAVDKLVQPDATAMTAADRKAALDTAYGDLAASLRQEAACAMAAEKDGQRVERRRQVHPAVLLGLQANPADVYRCLRGTP